MNKNDYAPIAPMGWNSYDYYDTTVNEEQVRANAAYLAEHLKDAGYEYVVVDIEWYAKKAGSQRNIYQYIPYSELAIDEYSRLQPDPERFPSSADGTGFNSSFAITLKIKSFFSSSSGYPSLEPSMTVSLSLLKKLPSMPSIFPWRAARRIRRRST